MSEIIPVTLNNVLPAPSFEVIPAAMVGDIMAHIKTAELIPVIDKDTLDIANAAVIALHKDSKDLTEHAESIKKPLNSLLKAVRECISNAETPLLGAKQKLQARIAAWHGLECKRIAEEKAKAEAERAKAVAEAEAERKRLQAIADAEHAEKVAALRAKSEDEAKVASELFGTVESPTAVPKPPKPIVVAATVAPVAVLAPAPKSAVTTRTVQQLEIENPIEVPCMVGGQVIRPINEAMVKKMLLAGVHIPGCRLIEVEQIAMGRY